jgi:hypothetical protein
MKAVRRKKRRRTHSYGNAPSSHQPSFGFEVAHNSQFVFKEHQFGAGQLGAQPSGTPNITLLCAHQLPPGANAEENRTSIVASSSLYPSGRCPNHSYLLYRLLRRLAEGDRIRGKRPGSHAAQLKPGPRDHELPAVRFGVDPCVLATWSYSARF